jgi:poly(3-hydroxybutyrate) depolymerase
LIVFTGWRWLNEITHIKGIDHVWCILDTQHAITFLIVSLQLISAEAMWFFFQSFSAQLKPKVPRAPDA